MPIVGRRHVPPFPEVGKLLDPDPIKRVDHALHLVEQWGRQLVDYYGSAPSPHAGSHAPQTGSDPIPTATPTNPTKATAAEGSADTLMRSDATIRQGIVTTKGDVLGFDTVPQRIPIGADTQILTADSAEAAGLKWADAPATGDPLLDTLAWMPLTTVVAGVPELVWDADDSLIPTLVPI